MAAGAMLFAQAGDATKVMAEMRKALGGEQKLASGKTLSATGKSQRSMGETSMGGDYEMMVELPDKYFAKQAMGFFGKCNRCCFGFHKCESCRIGRTMLNDSLASIK